MTEKAKYKFEVKEREDGSPWLYCTPEDRELTIVGNGFLGIEFKKGTTYEEAQEIAKKLQGLTYTK